MAYIDYQNLPSTSTPLNATNLNSMQIQETGSNANGHYIKYADGTMIQYNKFTATGQEINISYGSIYLGSKIITFPIEFYAVPNYIGCGEFRHTTTASWGTPQSATKSSMTLYVLDVLSRTAGNANISWLAIGRWKA